MGDSDRKSARDGRDWARFRSECARWARLGEIGRDSDRNARDGRDWARFRSEGGRKEGNFPPSDRNFRVHFWVAQLPRTERGPSADLVLVARLAPRADRGLRASTCPRWLLRIITLLLCPQKRLIIICLLSERHTGLCLFHNDTRLNSSEGTKRDGWSSFGQV